MGAIDAEAKEYLSNPGRFADVFNFWLYNGREVIRPENLKELDTTAIALPYGTEGHEPVQKFRDVLKLYAAKRDERMVYMVLGLEEQTRTHYAMPVRGMIYDAMNYAKQVTATAAAHRRANDKLAGDEYLSGFGKDDRLMPVMTLTLSLSPDPWDGPMSLHDMLEIEDRGLLEFIPDYRLNLLTPQQIAEGDFGKFRSEVGLLMQCIKHRKDKNMDWMEGNEQFRSVSRSTASLINAVTGRKIDLDEKGEVINMWEAWENGLAQARRDSFDQGISQGISQGKADAAYRVAQKYNVSPEEAMDTVGISRSEWDTYAPMIRERLNGAVIQ